jgi:hypothetical protein
MRGYLAGVRSGLTGRYLGCFGLLPIFRGLGAALPVCSPKDLAALGSPVAFAHEFGSEKKGGGRFPQSA